MGVSTSAASWSPKPVCVGAEPTTPAKNLPSSSKDSRGNMKLNYKIRRNIQDEYGNAQLTVPQCDMQIIPNIILSPKEQQTLYEMLQMTWDHFVEKVYLKRKDSDWQFDESIIYPKDPTATPERIKEYKEYYPIKYHILKEHLEKTGEKDPVIGEIGVRAGYSAWTFMNACPNATYIGFDACSGTHGGQGGQDGSFMRWAHHILVPFHQSGANIYLIELDTQTVDVLDVNGQTLEDILDFIHLDGDHSEDGIYHDLDLGFKAVKTGGLILVDDIDYISEVKRGVDKWLKKMGDKVESEYRKSLRGEMIITKLKECKEI
jgi:predicted O-methyltransferase YrrM